MNLSPVKTSNYEQRTMNNEPIKQTQFKPKQSQFQTQSPLAQTMLFATFERQLYNEAPESLLANQWKLSDKLT